MKKYRILVEDKFRKYDSEFLEKSVEHISDLSEQSNKFLIKINKEIKHISKRPAKQAAAFIEKLIAEYKDLFPAYKDIQFKMKYTDDSRLNKFLKTFDLYLETEAGAFHDSRTTKNFIKNLLNKFRPYESILNNISLLYKNKNLNSVDTKKIEELLHRIKQQAERGSTFLKAILEQINKLHNFISNHGQEITFFTNDYEETYKGINIGIRLSDKEDLKAAKLVLGQTKEFINFCYKFNFDKHIAKFKKLVISSQSYYPKIMGSEGVIKAIAFFVIEQNLIFIPYDYGNSDITEWSIYHEFGHYFYKIVASKLRGDFYTLWHQTFAKYKSLPKMYPTQYAYTNNQEAFAEMFSWYFCNKSLRPANHAGEVDKKTIKIFEEILDRLNIKKKGNVE